MTNDILTVADIRTFLADLELSHFERYLNMEPSAVCACAGTEMSIAEQLKQPWATGIAPPVDVGDPNRYPPSISGIRFQGGYEIRYVAEAGEWSRWKTTLNGVPIDQRYYLSNAIKFVRIHSEARCLKDLQAARTAWEAEQKRKQAPESLSLNAFYTLKDGKYVLQYGPNAGYCTGISSKGPFRESQDLPHTFRTFAPKEIPLEAVV